jgi:hypothetical protein
MRIRPAALSLALLLAACASPAPSSPSSQPASTEPAAPLPTAGELYVVTLLDDAAPGFGVQVEAIGPTGRVRPIATIDDARPAGWDDASPAPDFQPTVGPTGLLVVALDRNGGNEASDQRLLFFDVTGGGRPTVEVGGSLYRPSWGPSGALLALDSDGVVVDPAAGRRQAIARPDGVELTGAWLADGSGWVATRTSGDTTTAGSLSADGRFTTGAAASFQFTGVERAIGADGGTLSIAVSDGATGSDTAIIEVRPEFEPPCQCQVWARFVQPGNDPTFGDAVWDANGTGLWLTYSQGANRWLSHLDKPMSPTKVADLPPAVVSKIVGISPDDRWVVLAPDESGPLVLVDTVAGESRTLAQHDALGVTPTFGGWVR